MTSREFESTEDVARVIVDLERDNVALKIYLAISVLTSLVALAARFAW